MSTCNNSYMKGMEKMAWQTRPRAEITLRVSN